MATWTTEPRGSNRTRHQNDSLTLIMLLAAISKGVGGGYNHQLYEEVSGLRMKPRHDNGSSKIRGLWRNCSGMVKSMRL